MQLRKSAYILVGLAIAVYAVISLSGKGKVSDIIEGSVGVSSAKPEKLPALKQPVRIASSSDGDIFVSDYKQGQVFVMDNTLNVIKIFQIAGRPLGISWDRGKLFVGNESTRRVEVYNRNGKLLYDLGAKVASPTDIAIDNSRSLVFVVDGQERVVKVFDSSGSFLSEIPKAGVLQEVLLNPTGIAIDPSRGEVAISDFGDPVNGAPAGIKIYDYEGIFRFSIIGDAVQSGYLFSRPQGLAINSAGNFFMVDSMLGKVLAFDRNTKLGIRSLGSFGTRPGQLKLPLDLIINPDGGDILVTNTLNGRIETFQGGGLP